MAENEMDALMRESDKDWFRFTGNCGFCGMAPSSCDCLGVCGCADLHGGEV